MSNLHFTPKFAMKASVNFKPQGAIKKNQTKTATIRKNHFGDTKIKFPLDHEQPVHDAQKLITYVEDKKDKHQLQKENAVFIQNTETQEKKSIIYTNQTNIKRTSNLFPTNDLVTSSGNISIAEDKPSETIDRNKMVHLIGYVENVMRWSQILKNAEIFVLYNVLGTFIKVLNGIHLMEKYVFIRGSNGSVLECNYFEVDRPFPQISKGQFIGCLGHMYDAKKLKLYDIQLLDDNQRTETQRAVFLSQRMVHELNNEKQ